MLMIREVARLVRDLLAFAFGTRRFALLLLVVIVAVIISLATAVTTVGPVAVYPFL